MSMHKIPLTPIEESGLRAHGLDIGKPSQLSDAFRQGVRYASAQLQSQVGEAVEVFAYGSSDGYQPVLPRQSIGSNGERISCYDKPLMTVAQHKRLMLALAIRCEQKGAFKTCMECGYQDGHDMICQYHESKRANQRLEGEVKRLREALEGALTSGRGTSGRIILDARDEAKLRAALSTANGEEKNHGL